MPRLFGETRSIVVASSLTSIYENYKELEELWDCCLDKYKHREAKAQIHGVRSQMQMFEYFFGLRLAILLLRHSDNFSTSLQRFQYCGSSENFEKKPVEILKNMRWDEKLKLIWKDAESKAASLRINPPKLPRKSRRAPSRIEECVGGNALPEFEEDIISYYRKIYYEAPDCITNAILDRFDQKDFKTYIKLENLLIKAPDPDYNEFISIYPKGFWWPLCLKRVQIRSCFRSVFSCIFSVFTPNTGKYGPEITPFLDTFHAKQSISSTAGNSFRIL